MSGSAPPFHVPGHQWDPVKKRFFKSNPSPASPSTSTANATFRAPAAAPNASPHHPSLLSQKARKRRSYQIQAQHALKHRLGLATPASDLMDLRSRGRITMHHVGRLRLPGHAIASRFRLRSILHVALEDGPIIRLVPTNDASLLYAVTASHLQPIHLLSPPDGHSHRYPSLDTSSVYPPPRVSLPLVSYPANSQVSCAPRANTLLVSSATPDGVQVILSELNRLGSGNTEASTLHVDLSRTGGRRRADLYSSAVWEPPSSSASSGAVAPPSNAEAFRFAVGIGPTVVAYSVSQDYHLSELGRYGATSDAMALCFAGPTRIYSGRRSGQVVAFDCSTDRTRPPRGRSTEGDPSRSFFAEQRDTSWIRSGGGYASEVVAEGPGSVTHVATVDDTSLVVAWTSGKLVLLDLDTRETKVQFEGHANSYSFGLGLALDTTYRLLACTSQSGATRLWTLDAPLPLTPAVTTPPPPPLQIGQSIDEVEFPTAPRALLWVPRREELEMASDRAEARGGVDGFHPGGVPALAVAVGREVYVFE